jgi:hypothetical protein
LRNLLDRRRFCCLGATDCDAERAESSRDRYRGGCHDGERALGGGRKGFSAVRGSGEDGKAGPDPADAGIRTAQDASHRGLELAQRTAAAVGEVQRETARQVTEGTAELGRLYAELLDEQFRHNQRVAAALGRAVRVDWDEAVRVQSELMRATLERLARLNDHHLEMVRAVMVAASSTAGRSGALPKD